MSVEDLTPLVEKVVECNAEDLWHLSRFLCDNPELALQEFKAHDKMCDFLEGRGFVVERRHLLDTAFRAEFQAPGGSDGPTVAIMAEYDALPDIGHACGHNLIAEAAAGAAIAAMEAMKKSSTARGKLVVIGTPAEECKGGKEMLVQRGAFEDIDVAMMVHPMPQDTLRLALTASQQITVSYQGKATHAAACPWEGANALDAAVASYVNVALLRQQTKPSCRIHGIITESGSYCNIIPDTSKLMYHIRGNTIDELHELVSRVEDCFEAAAKATNCTMTMTKHVTYKDLICNVNLLKVYRKHGQNLGVKFTDADLSCAEVCGASTDAGNVSHELPIIHPMFAIRTEGANHTAAFAQGANSPEAQPPTLRVAKIMALTALDLFTDPTLVSQVKREFAEWKNRQNCQKPAA
ncbi:xaa-Arg dipeptidase-like isoform X1 [Dermacentor albipictus]|uniref:xaa-Arg dipeptidase-like isoform X1 n=1 Tax=Dermacentor albipictus TaxID=60249 RepID=UPI0031FDD325